MNAKLFDHTILKADSTKAEVKKICQEAKKYGFASVCVNSYYTEYVAQELKGTDVRVCTVIGFPLGQMSTKSKVAETEFAIQDGAKEIDMVLNIGALKDCDYDFVREEIKKVKDACGNNIILKVIIETCLLTDEEKVKACEISKVAGADYVKTSTGFSTAGANAKDVALMRKAVGKEMGVKASGGIRNRATAEKMIEAGATRLGTSSSISIIQGD